MATSIAHQVTFLGVSRHREKILTRISSIAGWVEPVANPLRGVPHGELLKLCIDIGQTSVAMYGA